jgi:F420H(2)-dependent biliverdin reductase
MSKTTTAGVKERLSKERNIWIATVRRNGRPHIVPVWFACVDDRIYVCIEPQSVKGRNLAGNQNVALALEDGSHPIICEGEGRFLERPWPEPVVDAFREKYQWSISSEQQYTALVEVTPRKWLKW